MNEDKRDNLTNSNKLSPQPSSMAFVEIRDTYKESIKNLNINKVSFGTVFITEIPNPFKLSIQKRRTAIHGKTLREYVQKDNYDETNYCIILNGVQYKEKEEQEKIIVKENDVIVYFPYQEWAVVGYIANAIMSVLIPYGASAAVGYLVVGISYALAIGIVVAGMILINGMLAPDLPDNEMEGNLKKSKTYSWDGITTNRDINSSVPVLYGTHVIGGTEINKYQYYQNSDDWLALQLGLCYGDIEEISSADIYVNGQAYNNFVKNANDGTFQYRDGSFDQSIMIGFDDTSYNNGNVVKKLTYNEPYTFQSESDTIDSWKIHFEFPKGLYHLDAKKSNYYSYSVNYSIAYKVVGESEWNYLNAPIYQKQFSISTYQTVVNRVKRSDDDGIPYYEFITEQKYVYDDWKEYNTDNISEEYEKQLQKEGRIRYRTANIGGDNSFTYTGNSRDPIKFTISSESEGLDLQEGKYEFQVTRLSTEPYYTYKKRWIATSELKLSYIEEINTTDINYGGIAQLGLNLKATEHIQGQQPNITTKVTRKPLTIYTKDDYSESFEGRSNNPAWICYDILTNPFYGAKIKPSQIDLDRFQEWANFCDLEHIREETIISLDEAYTTNRLIYNSSERTLKVYKTEILQEITSIELSTYNKGLSQITLTKDDGDIFTFNTLTNISESTDVGGDFYLFNFSEYNSEFTDLNISNIYVVLNFASIDFITLTELGHPLQLNFNGVFDSLTTPWDACQKVGKLGRGQILLRGNTYSCTWDGIQPITNMFNVGDIKKDSFNVSYTPLGDLATELEVQYADESIRNELNAITILDKDLNDTKRTPNTSTVNAIGITTKPEAIVFGRYMLATTKFQRRNVSWESDIKGLPCEVGDVVAIQNDIPLWGSGGRIQDKTLTSVTLEEPVTLTSDKVYILKVQNLDNTFTDYYLNNQDLTDTYEIPLPDTSLIQLNSSYIFGENNNEALLVRLTEVKQDTKKLSTKFKGVDYNPSILDFNYNNDILTTIEPSLDIANELLTFNITEEINIDTAGKAIIDLGFTWSAINTSEYDIYAIPDFIDNENIIPEEEPLEDIPQNRIYLVRGIKGVSYIAENVGLIENRYRIFIKEVGNPSNFIEVIYTVNGKKVPPPDVDIFTISGRPNETKTLVFDIINPPPDLVGYVIKYQVGNSLDWNTASKIHEGVLKTSPYKADITKVQGQYNLLIKAVDIYGNESVNPRFIKFNQGETLIDNLIYEKDFHAEGFIGEIFGGTVQPNNDLLANPSTDFMYYNFDTDLFYSKNDGENFYQGLFEPMYFIGTFIPDGGGTALVEYSGTASPRIEYREYYPKPMYTNNSYLFYTDDVELMYQEDNWSIYSGGFPVQGNKIYELRVSYAEGTIRPGITSLKIKVDVEDIDESFEDILIEVGGTTINTKYITNLKNVVATLQSSVGSTASRVEVISKTLTSATLKCFDTNGTEVQGLVDIRFKGYINA